MRTAALPPAAAAIGFLFLALSWLGARESAFADAAIRHAADAVACLAGAAAMYVILNAKDRARAKLGEQFRLSTDMHAAWYWEIDADLTFTVLEGEVLEEFGIDPREAIGNPSKNLYNFTLTEITSESFAQIRAARLPYRDVRAKVMVPGRGAQYVSISGDPVFSADGSFAGYRGLTRQVTAQVEAELALEASEERFRRIVETVPNLLFFITNPARDRWIYRSPNWGKVWNYQGALPSVGRVTTVLERILPEDRPLYDGRASAEERGEIVDIEYRIRDPDAGIRWLRTRTIGMPGADGEIEVYGVTEDVTAQHRIVETMAESEALHRSMLESMAEGMIIRDLSGKITAANAAAERILGMSESELLGRESVDSRGASMRDDGMPFTPDDFPWKIAVRTGQDVPGVIMGVRRRDLSVVWTRVNAVPLKSPGGAPHGVLVTFQDVTVERAAVAQLADAAATLEGRVAERTAALEKTNRELEAFAYSVSHDLRAPLRAINGFARLLADREGARLDAESRRLLSRIEAGAGRMGELIDDVIEYSGATRREPVFETVDLDRLASSVATRLAQAYPATRLHLEPLGEVRGDVRMLERIIENLVGNALKFSANAKSPQVRVWAEAGANGKTIHVADNGAGFDMAHAGHLFNLFRRLHHDSEFPGTGVGLATVKNLVERHSGEVFAHGETGGGARFSFRLGG